MECEYYFRCDGAHSQSFRGCSQNDEPRLNRGETELVLFRHRAVFSSATAFEAGPARHEDNMRLVGEGWPDIAEGRLQSFDGIPGDDPGTSGMIADLGR